MNILISTTTNWNPGDDFIRFGVKNILKHIIPSANYINYDRNPNNMVDWPRDQRMKEGLHGTFMNNPIDWSIIDLVVLAGSPEFLHHPLAPIYEGLMDHPDIPLWSIGVGYSEPSFLLPLTQSERTVLKRDSTLIITRQEELSGRLFMELSKECYTLPCPALFCFEEFPVKAMYCCKDQIVHSLEEFTNERGYFNSDPTDTLNHIGKFEVVITTRLHGAIAAISSGSGCVKLINDSFRAQEAIKLFEPVMNAAKSDISLFKAQTLCNYINLIQSYYDKTLKGR